MLAQHPFEVFAVTGIALGFYKYTKIQDLYREHFARFDK